MNKNKEIVTKLLSISNQFKSKNLQDYFLRKITYDLNRNKYEKLSCEELNNEVEQLSRMVLIQNLYTDTIVSKEERVECLQKCGKV